LDLVDSLAWDIALAGPFPPSGTRDQFMARRFVIPFEAFKTHARGLAARDPRARITLVRRAVTLAKGYDAARVDLGRLMLEQRECSPARVELSRVPSTSPVARQARFLQGIALLELGRYHEAVAVYAALAQAQATPGVLNNYALALLRDPTRGGDRASDALRKALELDPESTDLPFNLAWALLCEDDASGAAFQLKSPSQSLPPDQHPRVVLTWALRRAGRTADAEREWQAVLALAPEYSTLITPDF